MKPSPILTIALLTVSAPAWAQGLTDDAIPSPIERGLLGLSHHLFPGAIGHDQLIVRSLRIGGGVLFAVVVVAVSWVVGREHKKGRL